VALITSATSFGSRAFTLTTLIGTVFVVMATLPVGGNHSPLQAPPPLQDNPCALAPKPPAQRAEYFRELIRQFGGKEFRNPPEVSPNSADKRHTLRVAYSSAVVNGCPTHLRSYNGMLVGETIRIKPGETIYLKLVNDLPPDTENTHPQQPPPTGHETHFSYNLTNLHTHGLHTAPQGTKDEESDNVLIEIAPKQSQNYSIQVHDRHPSGTFWYHPHLHGSTAIQISSGMAGALIVEGGADANGGLDTVPVIAQTRATEKIFVLQQFVFDEKGVIEEFTGPQKKNWVGRGLMVNGQLAPVIRMRPGEIQRWRFIHSGVQDNISLALQDHQLHEIAADGLALGRLVSWPAASPVETGDRNILLGPGYRTDVLVQANQLPPGETRHVYLLQDAPLTGPASVTFMTAVRRLMMRGADLQMADFVDEVIDKPEFTIAQIVVEGTPVAMALPASEALKDRVPSDLTPITDAEIARAPASDRAQSAALLVDEVSCDASGDCAPCPEGMKCPTQFMVNNTIFMPSRPPRTLTLGGASEWTLTGSAFLHPFHIHVNPFSYMRLEPGPDGRLIKAPIWKDTVLVPIDGPLVMRSRYTRFAGEFVMHCHILGHEDLGMMERVSITK
jgi:FtsP/CotA-like multicopper oxidase with cupredoxin domain